MVVLLLQGCDDAQLADFPQAKVSLEMTMVDASPHYRVTYETQEGMKVEELGIVQYYQNNNSKYLVYPEMTVVKLIPGEQDTYIGRVGYATDAFDAYAYLLTDIGYIRSDVQTMVVPGSNIPLIKEARFDFDKPTGNKGTIRIYGENFTPIATALELEFPKKGLVPIYPVYFKSYPDSVIATNIECRAYGHYELKLLQYDRPYPFEVDIKGLHLDSVSPSTVRIGEPMTIYYSDATPGGNYEFYTKHNYYSSSYKSFTFDKDDHHIKLLLLLEDPMITSQTSKVLVVDKDRGILIDSDIEVTDTRDPWTYWTHYYMGDCSCKVGNYICMTDGKRLYGYNLDTQWQDFQPKIKAASENFGYKLHSIDDRYAYLWYWTTGTSYLCRYDVVDRKWEDVTSLTTPASYTWFEDATTFRALKGNKLFTYHLDTNTWDDFEFLYTSDNSEGVKLDENSVMCGTYKDYVYFGQSGNIYRYPVGSPKDISFVGKPNWPLSHPLTILNDNFYFTYEYTVYKLNRLIYKMPMTSLIEGTNEITCVGVPDNAHNLSSNKVYFYETETNYLVFTCGYLQAMNK